MAKKAKEAREAQDLDMDQGLEKENASGEEEEGVSLEGGNRRKVVRKGRFSMGAAALAADQKHGRLTKALRRRSDSDKLRCMRMLGKSCSGSAASDFDGAKKEFNGGAVSSNQEDAAATPCLSVDKGWGDTSKQRVFNEGPGKG